MKGDREGGREREKVPHPSSIKGCIYLLHPHSSPTGLQS
jgi:hypothetical protein